jgi:hypothetical protein
LNQDEQDEEDADEQHDDIERVLPKSGSIGKQRHGSILAWKLGNFNKPLLYEEQGTGKYQFLAAAGLLRDRMW